ncbi:MAG: 4-hydroxy-tetrahydrodipicolinate synthase, partial [Chloroflexi bacterium]
ITAMVTPFDASGVADPAAAARLARSLVASGSDAVVVNGTTGESPTLSRSERLSVLDAVRAALPDHGVLMGTGSYDTASAVAQTREALEHGADAALVVSPYYNRPPQEGLIAHFEAVADVGLRVVLYNIPSRCGVNLPPATQLRLAGHPNIVGTKEAAGDVEQCAQICAGAPPRFTVWSGDDALTLPFMSVGAAGVVSVASHVAGAAIRRMIEAHLAGRPGDATRLHHALLPLFKGLFVTANPIPVKAALGMVGFDAGSVRLPLVPLDDDRREELGALLRSLGDLVCLSPATAPAGA